MKRVYRFIGILLSVCILLFPVLASPPGGYAAAAEADDTSVAEIYLCVSGIRLPYLFGHSWICIVNTGSEPFSVGSERLEPGEMLTAGLHTNGGMVFNLEKSQFRGRSVTAVQASLTKAALQRAENEIFDSEWDHYSLLTHNCTHFSVAVWKAATGKTIQASVFPFFLKMQMPSGERTSLTIV